ncbi:MAG: hypothetical protein D6718_13655 [Acidobacteria bacterium]|nr:MAG: hypothetical protein D6718_13655 [Acidobacteriota bacterium]
MRSAGRVLVSVVAALLIVGACFGADLHTHGWPDPGRPAVAAAPAAATFCTACILAHGKLAEGTPSAEVRTTACGPTPPPGELLGLQEPVRGPWQARAPPLARTALR